MNTPRYLALAPLLAATACTDGQKNIDTNNGGIPTDPSNTTETSTGMPTSDLSCAEFTDQFNACLGTQCDGLWGYQEESCLNAVEDCNDQVLGNEVLDCCEELESCLAGFEAKGEQFECIAQHPIDLENGECCAVRDFADSKGGMDEAVLEATYGFAIPDSCNP